MMLERSGRVLTQERREACVRMHENDGAKESEERVNS